jgi:hypothetical protein
MNCHRIYIYYTVYNRNDVPDANHPTSCPRIIVEGKRLELSKRLLVPFGQLAILKIPGKEQHKISSRVEVGVTLGPSERTYGAVRCFSFASNMVVTSQNIELLG